MYSIFVNNPLFIIFLVPIIIDIVGTVTGQKKEYWKSNFYKYEEAVPVIHLLLRIHPLLFISVCLVLWLPITYLVTLYLPNPYNLWASLALFAGHSYNSVNWLRITQRNWGIFTGKDRISITLSLLPMTSYILIIGYLATLGISSYFGY